MASPRSLATAFPLPRPTLILLLVFCGTLLLPWVHGDTVVDTSPKARELVLRCRNDARWRQGNAWVYQYQCGLNNTATIPVGNVKLRCTNYKPIASWNINHDCTVPRFIYPSQVYTFGYQTTSGEAKFAVVGNPYAQSSLRVKSAPKGSKLGLNCSGVPPTYESANTIVFQYSCTVTNSDTVPKSGVTVKTTNFNPFNYWNIFLNGTLTQPVPAKGSSTFGFQTAPANITLAL